MNLPFFIAKRYITHRKGAFSAFIIRLAIIATALSVATMVVATAFVTGFKHEIKEKLFSFWGHVHITPYTPNAASIITPDPIKKNAQLEQQVKAMPHVKEMTPFAVRPVIVNANKLMEGIQLKGVAADYKLPESIGYSGRQIDYSDSVYSKQIMLSQTTADRLNIKTGDELQLYFLEPGSTLPRIRKVQVAGIFHTGMEEVDKNYGLCDIRLLQRINNWQADDINGYQITLDDQQFSDTMAAQIFYSYLQPPLTTYTMTDIFPNIIDWLKLQDVNTRVIISIMGIVALINMVVVLLILIVEHSRMIGILKAQGISFPSLRKVFMYYAFFIGGSGIILGNIIGLGLCWLQLKFQFLHLSEVTYYVRYVPVRINWAYILSIDLATLWLCILCMRLPSLYIRRILPAKVLQFK